MKFFTPHCSIQIFQPKGGVMTEYSRHLVALQICSCWDSDKQFSTKVNQLEVIFHKYLACVYKQWHFWFGRACIVTVNKIKLIVPLSKTKCLIYVFHNKIGKFTSRIPQKSTLLKQINHYVEQRNAHKSCRGSSVADKEFVLCQSWKVTGNSVGNHR